MPHRTVELQINLENIVRLHSRLLGDLSTLSDCSVFLDENLTMMTQHRMCYSPSEEQVTQIVESLGGRSRGDLNLIIHRENFSITCHWVVGVDDAPDGMVVLTLSGA